MERAVNSRVNNVNILTGLKWALVLIFVIVLAVQGSGNQRSSTDFQTMREAVLAHADLDLMTEGDNQMIRRLYGLNVDEYEAIMLYYPNTNMGAEEILLVEMSDDSQQETVQAAIENRVSSQLSSFEGYGAEQTAMLENSVQIIRGNYALLAVSENAEEIRTSFEDAF